MVRVAAVGLLAFVAVGAWQPFEAHAQGVVSAESNSALGLALGTSIPGGYTVVGLGPSDASEIRTRIDGPDGSFEVVFSKRDDRRPAFIRTEHCNVTYVRGGTKGVTPASLGLAIEALVAAVDENDVACDELASPSMPATSAVCGATVSQVVTLGIPFLVAFLLVRLSGRNDERQRRIAFVSCLLVLVVAAGWLRFWGVDAPFVESASTQRIQVGAARWFDIISFRVFDYRHPPLTALVLHASLWFGHSERVLRAAFCMSSALSVGVLMVLARRLAGQSAAIGSGAVTAVLVPVVLAGWDIGSHALFALVAPAVLLLHHQLAERPSRGNAVVLGVANGITLWTHYFAPFLLLVQGFDLFVRYVANRSSRDTSPPDAAIQRGLLSSVVIGVGIGVLPLVYLAKSIALDRRVHSISLAAPDAVWGVSQVQSMLMDAGHLVGLAVAVTTLAFAAIGTTLLYLDRNGGQKRRSLMWIAVYAWAVPAAVLVVSPMQRMRDFYLVLSLPFLVLLAAVGAVRLPGWLVVRLGLPAKRRWVQVVQRVLPALLVAIVVAVAFNHLAGRGMDDLRFRRYDHRTQPMAEAIKESGLGHVAIIHGNNQTLFGFYLIDGISDFASPQIATDHWRYGDYHIHALTTPDQLGPDWRAMAERNLEALLAVHGSVALVDWDDGEETWPALERAGNCSLLSSFTRARLLECSSD